MTKAYSAELACINIDLVPIRKDIPTATQCISVADIMCVHAYDKALNLTTQKM